MKAITTLIFVLFIGFNAQAQNASKELNVKTIEMSIVRATKQKEVTLKSTMKITRLYKFKNSRIKKALSFTTKKNKAKMA